MLVALAVDGVYCTDQHLAAAKAQTLPGRDPVMRGYGKGSALVAGE